MILLASHDSIKDKIIEIVIENGLSRLFKAVQDAQKKIKPYTFSFFTSLPTGNWIWREVFFHPIDLPILAFLRQQFLDHEGVPLISALLSDYQETSTLHVLRFLIPFLKETNEGTLSRAKDFGY